MAEQRPGFLELALRLDDAAREKIMREGEAPAFEDLVGWEHDGINTAGITRLLGIRKFRKGFYEGPPRADSGPEPFIQGYNVPIVQDAVDSPHRAKPSDEAPKRFGFYRVYAVTSGSRDDRYPQALLLDYGLGGNGASPERFLRDYLVQVYPDDPSLLLGRAFVALGSLRVAASYFVLQRSRQHRFHG